MKHQRVTEILSPFTGIKYIDQNVLENAAIRGTKVHGYCEAIARGLGVWKVPEEHEGYVKSFLSWWKEGKEVLQVEKRFFCNELLITGQVDLIIKQGNEISIVDIKTSRSESRSWMLQGSAYSYMAKKHGYNVNKIMFLKLSREGKEARQYFYDENMELFKECLSVYRYFYGKKTKADGVNRDYGDDPEDFETKKRFIYQDKDYLEGIRGDYYDCNCGEE